jgi:predicted aconitase
MKTLGAACATSGGIALWHAPGVTVEADWAARYLGGLEKITIEQSDLNEAREKLVSNPDNPVYCVGCPHCSLREMGELAELVKKKDLDGRLWIFTSRGVYTDAKRAGYVNTIERANGRIYCDTCMVVAPLHEMGWEGVSTNSFKAGHYSVAHGFNTDITSLEELVKGASK